MWGRAVSAALRGLSALRSPAPDLPEPERVICGAAIPTGTPGKPVETLASRREALIARRAKMSRHDARRAELDRQLSALTTEALRR
jgi:hypothetical protein